MSRLASLTGALSPVTYSLLCTVQQFITRLSDVGTPVNTPRNAQTEAINAAIDELGGITQFALQDVIRKLRDLLNGDELPEKIMAVRTENPDSCLLVVTNHRLMLVGQKGFIPKLGLLWEFPLDQITSIEYSPGMQWHRITVHQGRKKKIFHNMHGGGRDKQFEVRKMAEYLRARIGDNTPVAKDNETARANTIEDTIRRLGDLKGMGTFGIGGELKQLPKVLAEDELPEILMQATYDDRDGLRVASSMNRMGSLVGTDRRVIFLSKEPFQSVKVDSFPYNEISSLETSQGMLQGKITFSFSGRTEIFEGDSGIVQRFARHLQYKTANPPVPPVKSKAEAIKDAVVRLGFNNMYENVLTQLPDIMEDDELPEQMTGASKPLLNVGFLIATGQRIIFLRDFVKTHLKVESFSYDVISSVESSTGLLTGKLIIHASGVEETFHSVPKRNVGKLHTYIQGKITGQPKAAVEVTDSEKEDVLDDAIVVASGVNNREILDEEGFRQVRRQLPSILEDDELPEKMTMANYFDWVGFLVATGRRLIFVRNEGDPPFNVESFPYDTISSVESSTGLLMGKLIIHASGVEETFGSVWKQDVGKFHEYIQAKIAG